jgi:4-amino-4-deoxy-L-arabinose transferase-like glycosyltransferase
VRLRLAQVLLGAAVIAAILAVWAWLTGGFRIHVLGVPLSVRGAERAAFVALACAILAAFLHDALHARLRKAAETASRLPLLQALVGFAALFLLWSGATFGTRATGGADVYGYVTQAQLWRTGDLHIRQDFVASIPWPNAEWSFSPLGYRPARDYTIVPTYPPGMPLLILAFSLVLGDIGVYAVPWVAGAALVLLTYALGSRVSNPVVGSIAALGLSTNPTVFMLTLSLMSDVPVTALWTASLLVACRKTVAAAAVSGVLAGAAILVRPNLVPLAIVPLVLAAWRPARMDARSWLARAAAFSVTLAPFPLFIGWLFNELYGSPFTSGYGDNAGLFAWAHVPINLARYPRWVLQSQGPLIFLFLLTPVFLLRRDGLAHVRAALLAFIALLFTCYLLYLPFDAWWWTRFLLPAYPLLFILASDVVWLGTERFGKRVRAAVVMLFALGMIYHGGTNLYQWDVHTVGYGEQKYEEIGQYVDRTLPRKAILITMQHSGTVRYYSGRLTVRYDYIDRDWLDRAIEHLRLAGYEPFILLDDWEVPVFQEKFASQKYAALVAKDPERRPCTHTTFLYRVVPRPGVPPSERIPQVRGCQ